MRKQQHLYAPPPRPSQCAPVGYREYTVHKGAQALFGPSGDGWKEIGIQSGLHRKQILAKVGHHHQKESPQASFVGPID